MSGPDAFAQARDAAERHELPRDERTYSRLSAERSRWYSGSSSIVTQYWLLGV